MLFLIYDIVHTVGSIVHPHEVFMWSDMIVHDIYINFFINIVTSQRLLMGQIFFTHLVGF